MGRDERWQHDPTRTAARSNATTGVPQTLENSAHRRFFWSLYFNQDILKYKNNIVES